MLAWEVRVFRRANPQQRGDDDILLAHWMTGVFGLGWLHDLVKSGVASDLGGNGYPSLYTIRAAELLPIISSGLPAYNSLTIVGDDYVVPGGWHGEVHLNADRISECPQDELLVIEAWDQS